MKGAIDPADGINTFKNFFLNGPTIESRLRTKEIISASTGILSYQALEKAIKNLSE